MKILAFFVSLLIISWMPLSARADLASASQAYHNKNYTAALNEFKKLAKLGNKKAQFNLGVMYLKGEGVKADPVEAYAWMQLANETPSPKISKALQVVEQSLSPENLTAARARARELISTYGNDALYVKLSPLIIKETADSKKSDEKIKVKAIHRAAPQYPRIVLNKGQQGWVTVQFEVYPDGSVHNPRVIESFPQGVFDKETLAALENGDLR